MQTSSTYLHARMDLIREKLASANDHDRWVIIDADQDLETVEKQIWERVASEASFA